MSTYKDAVPLPVSQECSHSQAAFILQYISGLDAEKVEYVLTRSSGNDDKGQYYVTCDLRVNPNDNDTLKFACGLTYSALLRDAKAATEQIMFAINSHPNP